MTKPPGRPKSTDPRTALTIRVRASILSAFPDANAARAAIEATVEAHYASAPSEPSHESAQHPAPKRHTPAPKPSAAKPFNSRLKGYWTPP